MEEKSVRHQQANGWTKWLNPITPIPTHPTHPRPIPTPNPPSNRMIKKEKRQRKNANEPTDKEAGEGLAHPKTSRPRWTKRTEKKKKAHKNMKKRI